MSLFFKKFHHFIIEIRNQTFTWPSIYLKELAWLLLGPYLQVNLVSKELKCGKLRILWCMKILNIKNSTQEFSIMITLSARIVQLINHLATENLQGWIYCCNICIKHLFQETKNYVEVNLGIPTVPRVFGLLLDLDLKIIRVE